MAAVCNGADDIAAWLLDSGASIEARDNVSSDAPAARAFALGSQAIFPNSRRAPKAQAVASDTGGGLARQLSPCASGPALPS